MLGSEVFIVFTCWNGEWTLDKVASMWLTCVLSAALINDMGDLAFGSLALCSLVTTFTLGGTDIVDGATCVGCAWLRWNSPAFTINSFVSININAHWWFWWASDMSDWSVSNSNSLS